MKIYTFQPIDSKMYIIIENSKALIVDPCVSEEALLDLNNKHVIQILVLLTHEHYDHISGVNWLRKQFPMVKVLCSQRCAEAIIDEHKNHAAYSAVLYMDKQIDKTLEEYGWEMDYTCYADVTFEESTAIEWEGHQFDLVQTPGHSLGSICIIMDNKVLFSGDSLVTGYATITRLPGGNKNQYQEITVPFLKSLDQEMLVYPGHGEPQVLKEYKL